MSTLADGASVFVENNNGSVALEAKGGNIIVRNSGNNVAGDKSFVAKGNNDSTIALINVTTDVNSTFTNRFVSENGESIVTVDNAKELDIVGSSNSDIIVVNNLKMDIVNAGDASDIVRINGGNVISVDAGDGNDIVVASGTGHVIEGGSGNDILRIDKKAGNNITVNGGAGNDIITVASGNGHILVGGAGNDKYVISLLEANANYTIDQQSALTSDRDILSMSKYNSKDFHVVLNSNNDLLLKHENGAIVTVHDWQNHALNMVYFKDCALNCKELETRVEKTIYINSDGDFDAGDGNYTYIFDFDLPENSEGEWSSVNHIINVYGADSDDSFDMRKYAFCGSIDGYFQRDNINIIIQGNDLTISSYIQDQNNLTSMYIACNLKDYMSNGNNLLVLDGQTCAVIGNGIDAVYDAKLADRWCFKGNDFNITLEGVTTDNVLDLTSFYIDDGDGWNFYHKGNDLVFEFSRYSYDENKTKVVGTLTLKNALVDSNARPVIYTCESAMRLKIGTVGADTFTVGDIPNGLFGYFYYGNAGNDRITLDNGISAAFGGDGDDIFYVKNKSNGTFVYGGNGKDTVTIDQKTDGFYNMITDVYVHGGADADNITVNAGQGHVIYGDEGDDTITINKLDKQNAVYHEGTVVYGGAGSDTITVNLAHTYGIMIHNGKDYVAGDKDKLVLTGLSSQQVDLVYDRCDKKLNIYKKTDPLNYVISVFDWDINPFDTIKFSDKTYDSVALSVMTHVEDLPVNNGVQINGLAGMENFVVAADCQNANIAFMGSNDSLDFTNFKNGLYCYNYEVLSTHQEASNEYGFDSFVEVIDAVKFTLNKYSSKELIKICELDLTNLQFANNVASYLIMEFYNSGINKTEEINQYLSTYDHNLTFIPGNYNLEVDESLNNFSLLNGNDNLNIINGDHNIKIGTGNDIVNINSGVEDSYIYIESTSGDDTYNIMGRNVSISDYSGNDIFYVTWDKSLNLNITSSGFAYQNSSYNNNIYINDSYNNYKFKQKSDGVFDLVIQGNSGGQVTISNWNNFTFIFDDKRVTSDEIAYKIANSKVTLNVGTGELTQYDCDNDLQETFIVRGNGWDATIDNFSEDDKIDLSAYRNGNYVWGFEVASSLNGDDTYSNMYSKDAAIKIYDISSGNLNVVATIKLTNLFKGDSYEYKYIMVDDYSYGYSSSMTTSVSNSEGVIIRPINQSGSNLIVSSDNVRIEFNSNDKVQTIELNGYNDYVNTSYRNDTIYVNGDYCSVYGNSGDDSIYLNGNGAQGYGDSGNDTFYFNCESSSVTGGEGCDTYKFESLATNGRYNIDTVVYYGNTERDILDLSNFSINDFILMKEDYIDAVLVNRAGANISVSNWANFGFSTIKFAEGSFTQQEVEAALLNKSFENNDEDVKEGAQLAVMQSFMGSLDNTTKSGFDAIDEAVASCSGGKYDSLSALVGEFKENVLSHSGAKGSQAQADFLKNYCGIDLNNTDTGAISGFDAGNKVVKTAESVVEEPADYNVNNLISDYNTDTKIVATDLSCHVNGGVGEEHEEEFYAANVNGVTFYWNESSWESLNVETDVLKQLVSGVINLWAKGSFDLINESYGLSLTDAGSTLQTLSDGSKGIQIYLENDTNSGALAYVWSQRSFYPDEPNITTLTDEVLVLNTAFYNDAITDVNGNSSSETAGYMDRVLAHEMVHGVVAANVNSFDQIPTFINEGLAELVHGVDDEREYEILNLTDTEYSGMLEITTKVDGVETIKTETIGLAELIDNVFNLEVADSKMGGNTYGGGYMLLRYLAKQVADNNIGQEITNYARSTNSSSSLNLSQTNTAEINNAMLSFADVNMNDNSTWLSDNSGISEKDNKVIVAGNNI